MNSHILILTISDHDMNMEEVEAKLDKAKDWLRYSPGAWLIHTGQTAETWYARLRDTVASERSIMFICEVNLEERSGKMPPQAWTWMKKARQKTLLAS